MQRLALKSRQNIWTLQNDLTQKTELDNHETLYRISEV